MKIETIALDALIPYARNSRTHSDAQIAQVAASIVEFGFTNPVLIDAQGGIIAGHGRVMAARKLAMDKVPCIRLGHLSEAQKRAYVIADNKLAANAGWDEQMLALEFKDLQDMGFDLDLTGFDDKDINAMIASLDATPEGNTDADATPAVQAEVISKLGDIWTLGKHRIMCGDSTDTATVNALFDGRKAMLMQTDPPYGIAYASEELHAGGKKRADIENDDLLDGAKLQEFLESAIRAALPHLEKHVAFYLWHPMLTQGTFFAAAAADILIHRQIIWAKPVLLLGRGDYHWKHELCFYGWVRGNRPPFYGPKNQTTVWEIAGVKQGERNDMNHPTPKPVALWIAPIENHTKAGEIMYEPFSGSGSQIIAAEQTARICYAMELSPAYVDVSVRRWQQYTGNVAVNAETGEKFPG